MDERTNTPQDRTPNYSLRRAAVASGVVIGVLGIGAAGGAIVNEINHNERTASAIAEYENNQDILADIKEQANQPVDPANIVGIFDVSAGQTVNSLSIDIVNMQPDYQNADEANKNWIDYTILESGKAQGSYDIGDTFVVSRAEVDGKETLIVQGGEGLESSTLPSTVTR